MASPGGIKTLEAWHRQLERLAEKLPLDTSDLKIELGRRRGKIVPFKLTIYEEGLDNGREAD